MAEYTSSSRFLIRFFGSNGFVSGWSNRPLHRHIRTSSYSGSIPCRRSRPKSTRQSWRKVGRDWSRHRQLSAIRCTRTGYRWYLGTRLYTITSRSENISTSSSERLPFGGAELGSVIQDRLINRLVETDTLKPNASNFESTNSVKLRSFICVLRGWIFSSRECFFHEGRCSLGKFLKMICIKEKIMLIRTSGDNCAHSLMERSSSLKPLYDPA
jgi:hypothetical protein